MKSQPAYKTHSWFKSKKSCVPVRAENHCYVSSLLNLSQHYFSAPNLQKVCSVDFDSQHKPSTWFPLPPHHDSVIPACRGITLLLHEGSSASLSLLVTESNSSQYRWSLDEKQRHGLGVDGAFLEGTYILLNFIHYETINQPSEWHRMTSCINTVFSPGQM